MSHKLPESYVNCELLPFNRTALEADFILETPSSDPGGAGFRLIMQGTKLLVSGSEGDLHLPGDELIRASGNEQASLYIGRWRGMPCRLQSLPRSAAVPPSLRAINILDSEPGLPLPLLSLAGVGNAILHWEGTSLCCDNCGGKMERITGAWGKKCSLCGSQHYPRIHPCIIVLVRREDDILLVRKSEWAAGRFGLVAGFVEFGENLEQTVVRELYEETGIKVANICYQGSQSWPFPSQLMTGFTAEYSGGELKLQADELEEGGWFPIDKLPQLPPRRSIARWLIDQALAEGTSRQPIHGKSDSLPVNDLQVSTNKLKG